VAGTSDDQVSPWAPVGAVLIIASYILMFAITRNWAAALVTAVIFGGLLAVCWIAAKDR
jgi:hypothetical protein